jgi:MFS family permease
MHIRQSAVLLSLAGFIALAVAMGIGRFAFTPLLPMMQNDSGIDLAQGGWLASANYLGYLVGALMAASVRWPPAIQLRAGLFVVVGATALMGLTSAWTGWLALRFIAGVASAWVLVSTSSICLTRLAAMGQSHRVGLVYAGVGCGIALTGVLCLLMGLAQVASWHAWILLGAVALAGTWAARRLWTQPSPTPAPNPAASTQPPTTAAPTTMKTAAAIKGYWTLILCYGLFGFGYILPATFLPAQARLLVADPALFGLAWPLFGLAAALSTLFIGRLAGVFQRRTLWAVSQLVMATGVFLPVVWPSLAAIVIAALCVGGTFMVVTMLGMQEAQAIGGTRTRELMAKLTAAFAAGQLAGPIFFSFSHAYFGADLGFALLMATAGLATSSFLLFKS